MQLWDGNLQLLPDRGANLNAQGGQYNRALTAVTVRDYYKVAGFLLDRGAHITTEALANAYKYLVWNRYSPRIIELLPDSSAKVDSEAFKDAIKTRTDGSTKEELTRLLRAHED